jgi:hypothetical protein
MKAHSPWAAYIAATIGLLGLFFEIGLHAWTAYRHAVGIPGDIYQLNQAAFIGSIIIGFIGLYYIDPKRAEGGATVLTRSVVAVGGMWRRTGARTGDVQQITKEHEVIQSITPTKTDDERGE